MALGHRRISVSWDPVCARILGGHGHRPRSQAPSETGAMQSHTPEVYRLAARADFNLLLSGHTHGGQICLPGGIPITLDLSCRIPWARPLEIS